MPPQPVPINGYALHIPLSLRYSMSDEEIGAAGRTRNTPLVLTLQDDSGQPFLLAIHRLGVGVTKDGERFEYIDGNVYLRRALQ